MSGIRVIPIPGMPEIEPGDNLTSAIADGIGDAGEELFDRDVVVVTHKVVSKAEGRVRRVGYGQFHRPVFPRR